MPFNANTDTTGKRWADFLDVSDFIAGAAGTGYIPYPESTDPDKRTEYRSHRVNYNADDDPGVPERHGEYKQGNKADEPYYIKKTVLDRNSDGILDYLPIIDDGLAATAPSGALVSGGRVRHYTVSEGFYKQAATRFPHHLPPTYDTAKGTIAYPTIVPDPVAAMTVIDGPSGTQTGTFTLTLRFQEDYSAAGQAQIAASHDLANEELFTALQTALSADVGDSTVTVNRPRGGGCVVAVSGDGGAPARL